MASNDTPEMNTSLQYTRPEKTESQNKNYKRFYEEIELNEKLIPIFDAEPSHSSKLGISAEDNGCNISIWADNKQTVDVRMFDKQNCNRTTEQWRLIKENNDKNETFSGFIPGMQPGDIYNFIVDGREIVDPYARAMKNLPDGQTPRCVVVNELYDWEGDENPNTPRVKWLMYEGHVKGSTYQHPAIPEHLRGTYAGIASDSFINHLKSLNISHLELLPIQHSVSEQRLRSMGLSNYWGYDTLGFFAPDERFSNGEQVKEFKDMVKKLHSCGIELILDVVYNHTPEGSSLKELSEQDMYHKDHNGLDCNHSGCGNTVNASSDKGMDFILESLRYWAKEMRVGGFRFDLATILARGYNGSINMNGRFMNALNSDPVLNKLMLIAEPWDCSDYRLGQFGPNWLEWNDQFRDGTRRLWCSKEGELGEIATQLACGSLPPYKTVNFITAHDGLTLGDLVSFEYKNNYDNGENNNDGNNNNYSNNHGCEGPTDDAAINYQRIKAMRNMYLSLFMSPGTPIISHGDEFARSQRGNNNVYCQDNELAWMNWNLSDVQYDFYQYVSSLTSFRVNHPILATPFTGKPINGLGSELDLAWFKGDGNEFGYNDAEWKSDKKVLGMFMSNLALKNCLLYVVNGSEYDQTIELPKYPPYLGEWEIVVDTATGEIHPDNYGIAITTNSIAMRGMSSAVLRRKRQAPYITVEIC